MQEPPVVQFEFVTGNRPDQLKSGSNRKVRSYLSKRAWQTHLRAASRPAAAALPSAAASSSSGLPSPTPHSDPVRPRRRRRRLPYSVTFEYTLNPTDQVSPSRDHGSLLTGGCGDDTSTSWPSPSLSIDRRLGGGRVDPFRSYAASWQPFIPSLVDHYIIHMAVEIPEIDQGSKIGLLRTTWFRLVATDTAAFPVVMLLSAANFVSVHGVNASRLGLNSHLLQLKHNAIAAINEAFGDQETRLSDGAIGAVAKMASFEAMHGDVRSYRLHMDGLKRMLDLRGGLSALGLAGLLRRIIIWIDLNSAFLFQIPRCFPNETFTSEQEAQEPNPAQFMAV